MTYRFLGFLWAVPRMCLLSYSHEAQRACTADQPTREEQNGQNEHGGEASTNDEQERTGPNFP